MKSKFLFPAILVAGLMFVNFSVSQVYGQTPQKKTTTVQTVKYTCPEHPNVAKDMPGNCPKCGMPLVEKKDIKEKLPKVKDTTIVNPDQMKKLPDTTTVKKEPVK